MAEYFARKYCSHLEDKQLTFLSNRRTLRRIGSVRAVRDFVHYLINRFVIILSKWLRARHGIFSVWPSWKVMGPGVSPGFFDIVGLIVSILEAEEVSTVQAL